jgi:hypothetical protein
MPFTAAHPAIVLPFARIKNIPLSVLVIGSITPDFEYFIKMKLTGRYSHTLEGIFLLDLPVAIVLCLLFHQLIKVPLINNLPSYLKCRLMPLQQFNFVQHFKNNFLHVIIGLFIGIFSHIVWDSFTHAEEVFVVQSVWLSGPLFSAYPSIPVFKVLQHISTLVGSSILIFYFHRLPVHKADVSLQVSYWLVLGAIAALAFSVRAWFTFEYFGDVVATLLSALCIGLIVSSFIYRVRHG